MPRLTSAEYAKTHGAAAGRQLHRERVAQFKRSSQVRHGGQTYTHGPWRSHLGMSNPQVEKKVRQFEGGRNASLALRFALGGGRGLFRRGAGVQKGTEDYHSYKRGGVADRALRAGGLEELARVLVDRHPLWRHTRDFTNRPDWRVTNERTVKQDPNYAWIDLADDPGVSLRSAPHKTPFGSFGVKKMSGANGYVAGPGRDLRLSPETARAVRGFGPKGGDGQSMVESLLLGNYGSPMRRRFAPSRMPSAGRKTLVHELIHSSAQRGGRHPWQIEGEAESLARKLAPGIYRDLGMPYRKYELSRTHPYDNWVKIYDDVRRGKIERSIWSKKDIRKLRAARGS